MANPKGIITRKDIIEDEALKWGEVYSENIKEAIKQNNILVESVKTLNKQVQAFKVANSQKDYITAKQAEALATQQAIDAIKKQEAAEISADKVKRSAIATMEAERKAKQAVTDVENKAQKAKQSSVKLTIEERVQNEINNKVLKQEALERLGLVSAYTKLNNARTEAKNKLRDLIASESASTSEIKKAQKEYESLDVKVRKADQAVGDFTKNVGNYPLKGLTTGLKDLMGAFGLVGGLTLFVDITKDIYNTTKELQSLDLALKQVVETDEKFAESQAFLSSISEKYGIELKGLTTQFTQFYVSAKDKISGREIQQIFESVAKSAGFMGLSVDAQNRAFTALNQMMSKGTVSAEELKGQLGEALPGAFGIMAKSMGVTEKQLGKMMQDGKVLASEVLPEFARQLEKTYGIENKNRVESLAASQTRLTNAWTDFIRQLNYGESVISNIGTKVIGGFQKDLSKFTEWLKSDVQKRKEQLIELKNIGKEDASNVLDRYKGTPEQEAKLREIVLKLEKKIQEDRKKFDELNSKNLSIQKNATRSPFGQLMKEDAKAVSENLVKIKELNNAMSTAQGRLEAYKGALNKKNDSAPTTGETDAQKKAREAKAKKAAQDKLDLEKRLADSEYELKKQRLEQTIKFNNEISADDTQSDDVRVQSALNSQKKQFELLLLTKNHLLEQDKLTANDRIRIEEDFSAKKIEVSKKVALEIEKINEFDLAKYQADIEAKAKSEETAMNNKVADEDNRFKKRLDEINGNELTSVKDKQKLIEEATQTHEENLFNIKKNAAIAIAKIQMDNLQVELDAFKAQSDGSAKSTKTIEDLENKLSVARKALAEAGLQTFKKAEEGKTESAKEQAIKLLEISQEMTGALSDLANAFSSSKIQSIDNEIAKNDEYYAKQIELAGNDQRKKDILQKESEKKRQELEAKKRKEQEKQAKFDKIVAIAQIAIQTALAIMKAAPNWVNMGLAGVMGAIQLAAAIATPIPKYKHGRKGGPEELAYVGDGGVREVIERATGAIEITPATDTLVKLNAGDKVHSSVDEYYRLQRMALISNIDAQGRKVSDFQATQFLDSNNKELVEEMRLTRKAIEKNKSSVIVNTPKMDINHHLWKMKNTNWN